MKFNLTLDLTVDVDLRDVPAALRALRDGDTEALLDRVDVVDFAYDISRP